MRFKQVLNFWVKIMISGILALGILSLLCLFYYNPPIAVPQPEGYTNYKYMPNDHWSNMTEGYGRGITNGLGYNDLQNPVEGAKTICFLGSSQTEALQVGAEKNFVALLEQKLSADADDTNDYQCLNFGISGHFFEVVVSNFERFADGFENVDYVVIEVDNVEFTNEELEKMLNEEYHADMDEGVFRKTLKRIPYLRLLVKQYQDLRSNDGSDSDAGIGVSGYEDYAMRLDPVMKKLSDCSRTCGFELVVLKHSPIALDTDNKAYAINSAEAVDQFKKSCEANGIRFLCTDEVFCEHVNTHAELPYGFSNSRPGIGHLNEVGHRLIAQQLYSELFAAKER